MSDTQGKNTETIINAGTESRQETTYKPSTDAPPAVESNSAQTEFTLNFVNYTNSNTINTDNHKNQYSLQKTNLALPDNNPAIS